MKSCAEVNRKDGVATYLPNQIYTTSLYKTFWFPSFNVRGDPLRNVWRNGLEKGATWWICAEVDRRDGVVTNLPKIKTSKKKRDGVSTNPKLSKIHTKDFS